MEQQTDTIPRVQISQILGVAAQLAATGGKGSFNSVRGHLLAASSRKAPSTSESMWTIARDVLSELSRLGYAVVGPLPRKRSEVIRLGASPCELTPAGQLLGRNYRNQRAQAYDELLKAWITQHPHFRQFTIRVLCGPLFIPDVTSVKQISTERGEINAMSLADLTLKNCEARMSAANFDPDRLATFRKGLNERFAALAQRNHLDRLDAKALVDVIQDTIVLPALLNAEGLSFDAVTFQHVLRASQDFLTASWTTSHPVFSGRVVFCTCTIVPEEIDGRSPPPKITHHGVTVAEKNFSSALIAAYFQLAKGAAQYVDAYALRAIVCVELRIQPQVFERCLAARVAAKDVGGMKIFTELPFSPPPPGEDYVKTGFDRIGLIKLSS